MSGNKKWPAAVLAGGLVALPALAGCASHQGEMAPGHQQSRAHEGQTGMDQDRSAAAPQAVQPGQPARTLRPDALDAPAATSVLDAQRSAEMAAEMTGGGHGDHGGHGGHGGHGTGPYSHVDAGRGPGAQEGSEKHTPGAEPHQHDHGSAPPPSGHEGHSQQEPPGGAAKDTAAVYACPMHPEVTSATAGKCPKCGMALVERRKR